MAGDERTGVCVMRLTAGLDSGPVALREEVADRRRRGLRGALGDAGGARRRAAGAGARPRRPRASSSSPSRTRRRVTYAEKIDPAERRLDPARPGDRAGRDGARPDPARRRLPGDGRRRAARRARGARAVDVSVETGAVKSEWGALLVGCCRGALRLEVVQPPGGKPMPVDAYLRGHSLPKLRARVIAPARGARLRDDPRRPSRTAPSPSAPSAPAPSGSGSTGRERAQAQRLAYGAVQRRGTTDAAIERLAGRSTRLLDPPVLAALRLGLYELLFADGTPDHAAVDQAVELVKGPAPPTPPASSTRSCAAPPASGPS